MPNWSQFLFNIKSVRTHVLTPFLLCAFVFFPLASQAETIRLTIASSHNTALPWVGVMQSHVVAQANMRLSEVESPYEIRWTEAYGGSLYKLENTLEAVEIGLTDIGWVGTLWELSKMPLQNVTYFSPFATDDFHLIRRIMNELHETMPALNAAWATQNQHFLGGSVLDTYHLMTNFPVESVDDLRGRKILAPGVTSAWLEGTGAIAVEGGLTSYYTQIQTGVADGVLIMMTGAPAYRIHEVAPYITLVGIGGQLTGGMSVNLDAWNSLPDDIQKVLSDLGGEYSLKVADELAVRYENGLAAMAADGAIVTELSEVEKTRWIEQLPNIAGRWADAAAARGYPAREVLEAYMNAIRAAGAQPRRQWDQE
ncbi:C4-dicarboxylate TRAP transporter substrate-binding protein [Gammaproteobacteria bacterium]|nr:C4-dicarboxylate TRAP transporter substrate-binding protein [Gammaproteobacteria bacterium]